MKPLLNNVPSPNNLQYLYLFGRKTVKGNCEEDSFIRIQDKRTRELFAACEVKLRYYKISRNVHRKHSAKVVSDQSVCGPDIFAEGDYVRAGITKVKKGK